MTNPPASASQTVETAARDVVTVQTPADPRYVAVIRMTGAAVCSRLGYTLDEVEDLKLAVDEAVSVAIESATRESILSVDFELSSESIRVRVQVPSASPADEGSYAWGVLSALSNNAQAEFTQGITSISFRQARAPMEA